MRVPGGRIALGMDKEYDSPVFVAELRRMAITPHVASKALAQSWAFSRRLLARCSEESIWCFQVRPITGSKRHSR
jgi:hypothetical protein